MADTNTPTESNSTAAATVSLTNKTTFPYPNETTRLEDYSFHEKLFQGRHYEAFNIRIHSPNYTTDYAKLRYVMANFAGLVSKVMADMIFSEPPKIYVRDGDQLFTDAVIRENKMKIQNYEQALACSYYGDTLYKLRVDKRHPNDEGSTVIIEQVQPSIYFPKLDPFNVTGTPIEQELAWIVKVGNQRYVRKEIHTPGKIRNEVYMLSDSGEIGAAADLAILGIEGLEPEQETGIDRSLLIHIPNWKAGPRHFGFSDYMDLTELFFAINNRLMKVDNILDKHSDPILAVPDGILDEEGKVKKGALGLIQRPEGAGKEIDPAYITWDANLESAFKEVDKLVEMLFMVSETSPDILGMGKGVSDSGRALKLKILRTVAKAQRKILYFDQGIKEVLYVAQLLAKTHDLQVDGLKLKGEAVVPEIKWMDGIPKDDGEQTEIEVKRIDAGLTTKKSAIMRIDNVDEDIAEDEVKDIDEETKIKLPKMDLGGNPFDKKNGDNGNGNDMGKMADMKNGDQKQQPAK